MKKSLLAIAISCLCGMATSASSLTLCEVYTNVYNGANKRMALIDAGGIGDSSAPRETNRQLEILNERLA